MVGLWSSLALAQLSRSALRSPAVPAQVLEFRTGGGRSPLASHIRQCHSLLLSPVWRGHRTGACL